MIVAVTCYYNPTKVQLRLDNYRFFQKQIKAEGIPLYTVELAFGDASFQLKQSESDHLIQVRAADVMWQKERLFNVLLEKLPPEIDKIVWIDCDIIYPSKGWSQRISDKLDKSPLIQPYTWAVSLPQCKLSNPHFDTWINYDCYAAGNVRKSFCYYACHRDTYPNLLGGHVGYVWAATRELLEKHKFYDVIITGAGDLFMCIAAWGLFPTVDRMQHIDNMSQEAFNHFFDWGLPFYVDIKKAGGPSYTEDMIMHLWHGDAQLRNYLKYSECLASCHFSPDKDLELDENGCWKWKRKNYWLHDLVKEIFVKSNPQSEPDKTKIQTSI
jgi:hypothetical protein